MADIANLTVTVDASGIHDYEYLLWFRCAADFGPSHSDVIAMMNDEYEKDTGNKVPDGWEEEE